MLLLFKVYKYSTVITNPWSCCQVNINNEMKRLDSVKIKMDRLELFAQVLGRCRQYQF